MTFALALGVSSFDRFRHSQGKTGIVWYIIRPTLVGCMPRSARQEASGSNSSNNNNNYKSSSLDCKSLSSLDLERADSFCSTTEKRTHRRRRPPPPFQEQQQQQDHQSLSSQQQLEARRNSETDDDYNNKKDPTTDSLLFGSSSSSRSIIAMTFTNIIQQWKGAKEFGWAQLQMVVVLLIAYIGNKWPNSYPRNDNHKPAMFWVMMGGLLVATLASLKHEPTTRNIQLLSRAQTEEWKGWMQWAFVMYHYYRVYYVYNEIRVFVSAYVWMTGFGNFLYFDKKQDFSIERAISMWLRINYFPLLLSFALDVKLELYYVVPLHTAGFFVTMATCYLAKVMESFFTTWSSHKRNAVAIAVCFVVHVIFYETEVKSVLKIFSDEYYFRFQVDKYSAVIGILSGYFWSTFKEYMNWCYGAATAERTQRQIQCMWYQRAAGVALIVVWWYGFGYEPDKHVYNPIHPYIFWMPVAGYLMVRNSSKFLTEVHGQALEFLGRITLETYVLQFHVFMCNKVQNIPIIIPGSGPDGDDTLQFLNMLLCGVGFVALAYWARQLTITTQTTVTDLVTQLAGHARGDSPANGGEIEAASSSSAASPLKADDGLERKQSDDISIMAAAPDSTGAPKAEA